MAGRCDQTGLLSLNTATRVPSSSQSPLGKSQSRTAYAYLRTHTVTRIYVHIHEHEHRHTVTHRVTQARAHSLTAHTTVTRTETHRYKWIQVPSRRKSVLPVGPKIDCRQLCLPTDKEHLFLLELCTRYRLCLCMSTST
jgi:hypothetical protein